MLSYESLPETLIGDNLRLKQVLINLTKNAMKFTPRGLVSIFAAFDHFDELLYIQIRDTGKGIRKEEMASLFTQFGKLRRTADQNSEGIGLGLLICQNIVRECGGTI